MRKKRVKNHLVSKRAFGVQVVFFERFVDTVTVITNDTQVVSRFKQSKKHLVFLSSVAPSFWNTFFVRISRRNALVPVTVKLSRLEISNPVRFALLVNPKTVKRNVFALCLFLVAIPRLVC